MNGCHFIVCFQTSVSLKKFSSPEFTENSFFWYHLTSSVFLGEIFLNDVCNSFNITHWVLFDSNFFRSLYPYSSKLTMAYTVPFHSGVSFVCFLNQGYITCFLCVLLFKRSLVKT